MIICPNWELWSLLKLSSTVLVFCFSLVLCLGTADDMFEKSPVSPLNQQVALAPKFLLSVLFSHSVCFQISQ